MPEQLVSDADHVALSRLVIEIGWRIDHGRADTDEFVRTSAGRRFVSRTFEVLFG